MPARRVASDPPESADIILGELRAQVREMIHQNNNEAQKRESDRKLLTKLEDVPGDIKEIKERLQTLEIDKGRREGERGVLTTVLKSPVLQWLAMLAVAVWAYIKGTGQ